MNIVITGATGVLGWRTVRELRARGQCVTGVARSARGRRLLESLGARTIEGNVFDTSSLTRAFEGADVVVNLLTRIPSADRMAIPAAWDENDRLRSEASAAVARAAGTAGAGKLVQESLAFVYADGGDAWLDEDAPAVGGGTTSTALTAEANARELFAGETVVLRFGLFIGPDSDLTQADVENARHKGISPSLGPRDAYLPTVWLDDAAAAVAAAAVRAHAGVYNVADRYPPTRAEIDAALARAVGRDALAPPLEDVPPDRAPVARSQRVSSLRLREETGWMPRVRGGIDGWRLVTDRRMAA